MIIAKHYSQFDIQIQSMAAYLTAENRARLGVSDPQYTEFTGLLQAWNTAFTAYKHPDTRTQAVTGEVQAQFRACRPFVRRLRQQIKHNAGVTLLAEDYAELFIHKDKTSRTQVQPPEFAPVVTLLETRHLVCRFEVSVPTAQALLHRAVPERMKIGRLLAVVPASAPPPARHDYQPIDNVGRSRFSLPFEPQAEGQVGFLICYYFNPRGQRGPESEPLKFAVI